MILNASGVAESLELGMVGEPVGNFDVIDTTPIVLGFSCGRR